MPKDYTPPGKGHTFVVPDYQDHADGVKAFEQFADSIVDGIGSGIDAPIDRDGQVIQALAKSDTDSTLEWKAGMSLRVVQDLPDDSEGDEGDVVFVLGDVPKGGGGGPAAISASYGAAKETKTIDGKTYDIYTFTDETRNDLSLTVTPDGAGMVDVLLVGGGGSGAAVYYGGGGGAGGFVEKYNFYLEEGTHPVKVGAGGRALTGSSGAAGDGINDIYRPGEPGDFSSIDSLVALGGGGGASNNPSKNIGMIDGSSGGGGCAETVAYTGGLAKLPRQGNDGGSGAGAASNGASGGGGGAGAAGVDATVDVAGDGGIGKSSMITGTEKWFAGGGGGSVYLSGKTPGVGGQGGGGNGSLGQAFVATDGEPSTGGGGGAASHAGDNRGRSGAGGSGIVIVRVEV